MNRPSSVDVEVAPVGTASDRRRSVPSSMAIEVADHRIITLCRFARGTRATVYTHPRRIIDDES